MHSCSDKRELVRAAQREMQLQPFQRRLHAAVGLGEAGEERASERGRGGVNSWLLQTLWWEQRRRRGAESE